MEANQEVRLAKELEDKQREYEDLQIEIMSAGMSPIRYPEGVLPAELVRKLSTLRQEVDRARAALQFS